MTEKIDKIDKITSIVEHLCEGMKDTHASLSSSMRSLVDQRDHIALAANAMNNNADAMRSAMETFRIVSDTQSKNINNLSSKIDKHADANTELLTSLTEVVVQQKAVCNHLTKLGEKIDRYEERSTVQNERLSDHHTRLTVIERSRTETKENTQLTKSNIIAIISVMAAIGGVSIAFMSYNNQPPPPPVPYQQKP